jgi:mono/diheme cytochrome c family protein
MRAFLGIVVIALIVFSGFAACTSAPRIPPIEPPAVDSFDPAEVAQGANLAAIGNCNVCHTAPDGPAFAGGLAVPTPFGVIYSTNITPDLMTGIGQWSEEAFARAMREGVNRDGIHLYPAFPYDHFTLVSDADLRALYAYMMTRESVQATAPENVLRFPFNMRALLVGWKALYLHKGPYHPEPGQDAVWNRGAYLVEGLGHCGACHTPRNSLGAEKKKQSLSGGIAEGWDAYAINRHSPAPVPWDSDSLFEYLRDGWHAKHGVARGPMTDVTANLGTVQESDVRAIATYIASQMGPQPAPSRQVAPVAQGEEHRLGAAIYEGTCADCHDGTRPLPFGGMDLALSTAMNAPDPRNLINVTLHGLHGPDGARAAIMPGFAGALSDDQLAALLNYMRAQFSDEPPWDNIEGTIREARSAKMEEGGSWP